MNKRHQVAPKGYVTRNFLFVCIASSVVILGGCTKNDTFAQAKEIFNANQATFGKLVSMIDECGGVQTISANPSYNSTSFSRCSKESDAYRDSIAKKLASLHLESATISWKRNGSLFGISFILTSYGIVGSGSGSAIDYFAEPTFKINLGSPGTAPLTKVPSHWWFVLMS